MKSIKSAIRLSDYIKDSYSTTSYISSGLILVIASEPQGWGSYIPDSHDSRLGPNLYTGRKFHTTRDLTSAAARLNQRDFGVETPLFITDLN